MVALLASAGLDSGVVLIGETDSRYWGTRRRAWRLLRGEYLLIQMGGKTTVQNCATPGTPLMQWEVWRPMVKPLHLSRVTWTYTGGWLATMASSTPGGDAP